MKVPAQEIEIPVEDQESILTEIRNLLAAGRLSGGRNVERFEEEFADYTKTAHAIAVSSGTAALELILLAYGVSGKSVIVPANTNFATFVAARRSGAQVTLCDVDPTTLAPSLEDIERVASTDSAAVVLVHMGGFITKETSRIATWCQRRGIALVEDAAHAHGSHRDGRAAGTFGLAGAYSFFATKVMTGGEGGMVVTDNSDLAAEIRVYRNLGKADAWISRHIRMGYNARMTEMSAVIARHQLARLSDYIAARQDIATRYAHLLSDLPGTHLLSPGHPYSGYKAVAMLNGGSSREHVKQRMAAAGIQLAGEIYAEPLHQQPVLLEEYGDLTLPGAELSCSRQICLPIYPTLGRERADFVARNLRRVVTAANGSADG